MGPARGLRIGIGPTQLERGRVGGKSRYGHSQSRDFHFHCTASPLPFRFDAIRISLLTSDGEPSSERALERALERKLSQSKILCLDRTSAEVRWELNRSIPEVPSPIFHDNRIYLVRNGGLLAAVDAVDGEQIYRERLGDSGHYSASPVIADGHLYFASNRGQISVAKTGDEIGIVSQHELGEPVYVTPTLDENTIYLRGGKHLWTLRRK